MRNCIVLGSGRSGTSMVAGSLAKAGYFMGQVLISPAPSNPKGFFEDKEINAINEDLLRPVSPSRPRFLGRWLFRDRPRGSAKWLARIRVGTRIPCSPEIAARIETAVSTVPYCFKDPRFSYTLPAWRPFLNETVFVCIFRHPSSTAQSILKESREPKYLRKVSLNFKQAISLWTVQYRHIIEVHRHHGEWLFLHYDQVLKGDGLARLESFLDASVDRTFPDSALRRSLPEQDISPRTHRLYRELCELADFGNALD